MKKDVLEIEADSLKAAWAEAEIKIPASFKLVSEEVLSDGKRKNAEGVADTVEEAFKEARKKVPADAEILGEKERILPSKNILETQALDEETARSQMKKEIHKTGRIDNIRLKTPARKGFLGIGKKLNTYEAEVFQPAVVAVGYRSRARIRVTISEMTETERLVTELIKIGQTEGFLTMPADSHICGRCGSRVVKKGRQVECAYCGLKQNRGHFNKDYRHIRAREIGTRLNDEGGMDLMQEACETIRAELGGSIGRELEAAWAHIGGWLP